MTNHKTEWIVFLILKSLGGFRLVIEDAFLFKKEIGSAVNNHADTRVVGV